jgi:hypothetical protein
LSQGSVSGNVLNYYFIVNIIEITGRRQNSEHVAVVVVVDAAAAAL